MSAWAHLLVKRTRFVISREAAYHVNQVTRLEPIVKAKSTIRRSGSRTYHFGLLDGSVQLGRREICRNLKQAIRFDIIQLSLLHMTGIKENLQGVALRSVSSVQG